MAQAAEIAPDDTVLLATSCKQQEEFCQRRRGCCSRKEVHVGVWVCGVVRVCVWG